MIVSCTIIECIVNEIRFSLTIGLFLSLYNDILLQPRGLLCAKWLEQRDQPRKCIIFFSVFFSLHQKVLDGFYFLVKLHQRNYHHWHRSHFTWCFPPLLLFLLPFFSHNCIRVFFKKTLKKLSSFLTLMAFNN